MYVRYFAIVYLLLFYSGVTWAAVAPKQKFIVYMFLPWKGTQPQVLLDKGIRPIHVIYEPEFFTDKKIDVVKIKTLALRTLSNPSIPVSFDLEFGNRFKPNTVIPLMQDIIKTFRKYNTKSLVGIYSTIPPNTYGQHAKFLTYEKLNKNYASLIHTVDFISPSLYNYELNNAKLWQRNAAFNFKMTQDYTLTKPVIPYISPIVRLGPSNDAKNGNLVDELSEEDMALRLKTLQRLGAAGCIIWASSQDRTADGRIPQFNPDKGWGRAVVEFIKVND